MSAKRYKEITKYLTDPTVTTRLFITPAAVQTLIEQAKAEQTQLGDEAAFRAVTVSFQNFVTSDLMKLSPWFKAQRVHTFVGAIFTDPATKEPRSDVRLLIRAEQTPKDEPLKLVICAPSEQELPDNYFETRVVEETRVLYRHFLQ